MSKPVWIINATSESGDDYGPKVYDHEPTEQDKKDFIKNETPEDLGEILLARGEDEGPGDFGSYVYLEVARDNL